METLFGGDARVQITMDQKNRHVQLRDMSNRGPLAGLIIVAHVGDIVRDTWFGCGSFPLGNIGDRFICHHRFQVWRLGGCKQGDLAALGDSQDANMVVGNARLLREPSHCEDGIGRLIEATIINASRTAPAAHGER